MAHDHEEIVYGMNEVKELFDAGVLTGTIVEVDTDNDKADVNISGLGQRNDVPIFYHCEGESTVEGGALAFEEGDNVYILNKEGKANPGVSDLKIVGFVDGLKVCEFYIDITINGKIPEYTKSLKIVDANDEEHFASSSAEEPNKVGPFQNVVWPAKIYLYYTGGAGTIFSYFKTPGEPGYYLCAKQSHGNYCREEWGRSQIGGHFGGSYTPTGDEEFVLSANRVEYLLHGTFSSKPTTIDFTTKLLGKLLTKDAAFDFSNCDNCSLVDNAKTWEGDIDSISYPDYVGAYSHFPANCKSVGGDGGVFWCGLCVGCQHHYIPSYESCSISDMAIMTDENGHNPVFNGATVQAKYEGVWAQCFQLEILGPDDCGDWEYDYCYEDLGTVLETRIWEWKMLPTPEDRI